MSFFVNAFEPLKIGIDFGGVLSKHFADESADGTRRVLSIDMDGAIGVLTYLQKAGYRLFLISFCGKTRAQETKTAIEKQCPSLFEQLIFVKNKSYKGRVCKRFGCDFMIDDTLSVLQDVEKTISGLDLILFSGDPSFENQGEWKERNITLIKSWADIRDRVIAASRLTNEPDESVNLKTSIYDI